uniref:Uncharacterized protein n=1 Tax=Trichobilharzia regenti TaxID=157069 RepID=A0AA85JS44_TRIRE|nr:unnamed protein product [Trichobilharzia regenti]
MVNDFESLFNINLSTYTYIGRTTRCVCLRIPEHHPAWLNEWQTKSIHSVILSHLVDTEDKIDAKKAFKVIYCIPTNLNFILRIRLLLIAEAVGIYIKKPNICVQKKLVQTLSLP